MLKTKNCPICNGESRFDVYIKQMERKYVTFGRVVCMACGAGSEPKPVDGYDGSTATPESIADEWNEGGPVCNE